MATDKEQFRKQGLVSLRCMVRNDFLCHAYYKRGHILSVRVLDTQLLHG